MEETAVQSVDKVAPAKPPLILTIDDEAPIREIFRLFLEKCGYRVIDADNGRTGLAAFHTHHPDLILVDLRMPEVDGLTVLKTVHEQAPNTPVIVISGNGSIDDVAQALRLGAWDYLFKPVPNLNMVRHAVERSLERAHLLRENREHQARLEQEVARQTATLREQQQKIERIANEEHILGLLGQLALQQQPLKKFLNDVLDALLVTVPWLKLMPTGAVFLTEDQGRGDTLQMVVARNMNPVTVAKCSQIKMGECLCGQAALESRFIHKTHVDADHTNQYEGMTDHGHYTVPITDTDQTLGVLSLYVPCGHAYDPRDEQFLQRVANILGLGIARRYAEQHIKFQAYHDDLTGLPNRQLLRDRMQHELALVERRQLHGALLLIDIDNFKTLNDSLGHTVGDQILITTAKRLQQGVRDGDTVASMGGDEFAILLPALDQDAAKASRRAEIVASKLQQIVAQPHHIGEHKNYLTASIGIALYPDNGESIESLLAHADAALHLAKANGREQTRFYSPELQAQADSRLRIERDLRQTLDREELLPYFQPQVDSAGNMKGAEVLLRWQHHELGWISPGEFIPIAEESGLIIPISKWLMRRVFACARDWCSPEREQPLHYIAINISPNQFHQTDFVDTVIGIAQETDCNPKYIVLEITEGLLVRNTDEAIDKIRELKDHGFRFSIDDFGTGYSSLAYLKRLPMDELKIDQSFVRNCHTDMHNAMIVETIISMAQHMELHVVAEGVETEAELQFLQRNNCPTYQGFYFSKPLPEEQFIERLKILLPPSLAPQHKHVPVQKGQPG